MAIERIRASGRGAAWNRTQRPWVAVRSHPARSAAPDAERELASGVLTRRSQAGMRAARQDNIVALQDEDARGNDRRSRCRRATRIDAVTAGSVPPPPQVHLPQTMYAAFPACSQAEGARRPRVCATTAGARSRHRPARSELDERRRSEVTQGCELFHFAVPTRTGISAIRHRAPRTARCAQPNRSTLRPGHTVHQATQTRKSKPCSVRNAVARSKRDNSRRLLRCSAATG
jgi:hypothetical protein